MKRKGFHPLRKLKGFIGTTGTLNLVLIVVGAFFIWFNWQLLDIFRNCGSISGSWKRSRLKDQRDWKKGRKQKMDEIIFEIIKVIVMVAALFLTRYLVPRIKEKSSADKLVLAEKWAKYAVLKAQQVLWAEKGQDRKAYVTEFLKEILIAKNIALSDEQLDVLIEAAVKQMKMEENAGIVIEAADTIPTSGGEKKC